jgi:hypothetical protein
MTVICFTEQVTRTLQQSDRQTGAIGQAFFSPRHFPVTATCLCIASFDGGME